MDERPRHYVDLRDILCSCVACGVRSTHRDTNDRGPMHPPSLPHFHPVSSSRCKHCQTHRQHTIAAHVHDSGEGHMEARGAGGRVLPGRSHPRRSRLHGPAQSTRYGPCVTAFPLHETLAKTQRHTRFPTKPSQQHLSKKRRLELNQRECVCVWGGGGLEKQNE